MKKNRLFLGVFIVVSVLYVIGILIDNITVRLIFKPLIILSLMGYYIESVRVKSKLFIWALFFSFLGDVFLLFESELYFMLGLGAFLISHTLFIALVINSIGVSSVKQKIIATIPFVITFTSLLLLLKNSLGALLLPVVVYGFVISVFGIVSLVNYFAYKSKASFLLLLGSVFFVTSDSILAINKFYEPKNYYPAIVIITYIVAQFLICRAVILSGKKSV